MVELIGRDRERAAVGRHLDPESHGVRVLVIDGDPGIGKTTVWLEALDMAAERGFRVLSCRPIQLETALAGAAVSDLLSPVSAEELAPLPAPQRRALEVLLLRVGPDGDRIEPRQAATALTLLLRTLSAARPLVLAVDDEQWLDSMSATLITYAVRRLGDEPIACVIAHRRGTSARLDIPAMAGQGSVSELRLEPLPLAALHDVVRHSVDVPLTRPAMVRLHRASGGNPLHALEIARRLVEAGQSDPGQIGRGLPEDLSGLVSERLRPLPGATRRALTEVAALSVPTVQLVDEHELAPAVQQHLVRIDDEGTVRFCHPLYCSAMYESLSAVDRRQLHTRLATLVGDPEEQARHLALASAEPGDAVAALLERGAGAARGRGAWEGAADLLEQAARLTPSGSPGDAMRRWVAAAEHHVHAGDRHRGRVLLEEALQGPLPRAQQAKVVRLMAEVSYNDDNFVEASRLFRQALDLADDPRDRVEILLGLSYVDAQVWDQLWDFPGAAVHARRALELAEEISDPGLIAEALGYRAMLSFLCGYGFEAGDIDRALGLEDRSRLVPIERRPRTMAALLALYCGHHTEARARLDELCAETRLHGDESDLAFALGWRSWLDVRTGDFAAAGDAAGEAASVALLTGSRSQYAWAVTQRAYVAAHRGDVALTRGLCAEGTELLRESGYLQPGIWAAASLTQLELSLGNVDAAWSTSERLVAAIEGLDVWEPIIAFFLPDALEALIGVGQLDRAECLVDSFEQRGRELGRGWAVATAARSRGLLLVARGQLDAAVDVLSRADEAHVELDMPFEHARTQLILGMVERRRRRYGAAREVLTVARRRFEACSAKVWADRAGSELDRLTPSRSEPNELTPAEIQVAELATTGRTNREIAAAMSISPKTVEATMGHVYRKLNIRSRAELGARMARRASGGARDS